jgi:hypothetical protein
MVVVAGRWCHGGRGGSSREGKRSLGLDQRAARIASDVDSRHVSVPSTTTGNGQPDAVDFGTSYNLFLCLVTREVQHPLCDCVYVRLTSQLAMFAQPDYIAKMEFFHIFFL